MSEHVAPFGTPITEQNSHLLGQLVARVRDRLHERADALAEQGRSLSSLGDLDELADSMVAALPDVHPWGSAIGSFYDTAGLMQWLGVSRQALGDRVRRGTLLACRTSDGHLLYPALQFGRNGQVRPGVVDAIGVLTRAGADGWTVAVWLTTPTPVFEDQSAVDYLVVHHSSPKAVAHVTAAATADAATWST